MSPGFGGFLPLLGDCGCGAGCRAGGGAWFRSVLLCLMNHDEKQNIKRNKKNRRTLSLCRKSL